MEEGRFQGLILASVPFSTEGEERIADPDLVAPGTRQVVDELCIDSNLIKLIPFIR